jgi:hypothetical protein
VGAVWILAGHEIRRRWRSVVVLTLVVGVLGAVVLATVAGARRTDSALARFNASSRSASVDVFTGDPTSAQLLEFGRVPDVSALAVARTFDLRVRGAANVPIAAAVDANLGSVVDRARIVAGRAADPAAADEITIGESLAALLHRGEGGHLDAESYTPGQLAVLFAGASDPGPPAGPRLRFRIVGIVRRPLDLGRKGALGGIVVLTPAFSRDYSERIGRFGTILRVRTRNGAADFPRVKAAALRIFGPSPQFLVQSTAVDDEGAQSAIDVLTLTLWIFAGVAALAGTVAIGIVLTREISLANVDQATLRALGLTRAQRIATGGPRALLIASGGALLAALGAAGASPLFPIGVARRAEPDLGLHADWAVLALGIAAVAAVVLAIGFLAALRTTRPSSLDVALRAHRRRSTVAELAARAGLAPTATNGLRMALQPGSGRTAVPVRSAFLGAASGILGVIGVLVLASSLNHLVTTPRLYGWTWDFSATDTISNANSCSRDDFGLLKEPGVGAVAAVCYGIENIQVDGHPLNGWSFTSLRGTIAPQVVAGRVPRGPGRSRSDRRPCTPCASTPATPSKLLARTRSSTTGSSVKSCSPRSDSPSPSPTAPRSPAKASLRSSIRTTTTGIYSVASRPVPTMLRSSVESRPSQSSTHQQEPSFPSRSTACAKSAGSPQPSPPCSADLRSSPSATQSSSRYAVADANSPS